MRVIGYAYEADLHCVDCAKKRFNVLTADELKRFPTLRDTKTETDEHGIALLQIDNEGNHIHPIFSTDEEDGVCGDCFEPIR